MIPFLQSKVDTKCVFILFPDTMKQFDHPHIIKLIGVCMDEEFYIVMELAAYGEVKRTSNLFLCCITL